MANLTEDGSSYEAGIYQLERSDAIDAGIGGNGLANIQGQYLANRTAYLKIHVDALEVLRDRGPVLRSMITLSADTTLVRATHMGTLIECSGYVLTLPVTAGMVEGDILVFRAGLTDSVTIRKNTSQTIPDAVLYGFAADDIVMQPGEQVKLLWKSGVWSIVSISQFSISSPVGTVAAFASTNVPTGWIKCNGASLLRTTYARLFANIGVLYGTADGTHFNAPDLRGEFIRGWDDGRAIDSGRAIATAQSDLFKAHIHTVGISGQIAGGAAHTVQTYSGAGTTSGSDATGSTGGAETRPRNVAMMYCIKY